MGKEISAGAVAGLAGVFVIGAGAALWILPAPHNRLHYVLAGSLATALVLAATYVMLMATRAVRRAPSAAAQTGDDTIRKVVAKGNGSLASATASLTQRPSGDENHEPQRQGQL